MRVACLALLALPALAQSPNPIPNVPVKACAYVSNQSDIIALWQSVWTAPNSVQLLSCSNQLAVLPIVTASVDTSGNVNFACSGLFWLPALTCPPSTPLPALAAGQTVTVYVGPNGPRIANPPDSGQIGEYAVASIQAGGTVLALWTGYPVMPAVNVAGCANGYTVAQTPAAISVTCN
jgi:hypothetical protein